MKLKVTLLLILTGLFSCCPASATMVRTALGTGIASGDCVISSIALSTGDLLVVGVMINRNADIVASVTWGPEGLNRDQLETHASANNRTYLYSGIIASGGTQTITVSMGGSSPNAACYATKYTNPASPALDKLAHNNGSASHPTSNATSTTAQANEALVAVIGDRRDSKVPGNWENSFNDGQAANTTGGSAASNASVNEGYLIVAATGAYTASKDANATAWCAILGTYKEAGGASPSCTPSLTLMGAGSC